MQEAYANIHHFNYDPGKGDASYDEEGEPLNGFYFEIIGTNGVTSGLIGPYNSRDEVEAACKIEWGNA